MLVNPRSLSRASRSTAGQTFIDWLLSDEGQKAIASYQLNGKQLFFPNAGG